MFTIWQIGNACDGGGMLLLFVDNETKVKRQLSYHYEDVFADAFTSHIQDDQLH